MTIRYRTDLITKNIRKACIYFQLKLLFLVRGKVRQRENIEIFNRRSIIGIIRVTAELVTEP